MNKIMLLIFFVIIQIILSIAVLAYYSGETIKLSMGGCEKNAILTVNGTLSIDANEYRVSNCTSIGVNKWFCGCTTNFSTLPNTINNYLIKVQYPIYATEELIDAGIINITDTIANNTPSPKKVVTKIPEIIPPPIPDIPEPINIIAETSPEPEVVLKYNIMATIMLLGLLTILIIREL